MDWDPERMSAEEIGLVADRIWREILERLPEKELTRVRGLLDVLSRRAEPELCPNQGMRGRWFMPGLKPATAWFDRAAFEPLASALEALWPELRSEIVAEEAAGRFRPYGYTAEDPADDVRAEWAPSGWDELRLWEDFKPMASVLRLPVAARALRAIVETTMLVNSVGFLAMEPGTRLPRHHDRTNWYVSLHMGIIVPPRCVLRVDDEERAGEEGKCLFFDNSFAHEAWNDGDARRIVLAAHVAHPLTTKVERAALRILQNRYWSLAALGHEATLAWARRAGK